MKKMMYVLLMVVAMVIGFATKETEVFAKTLYVSGNNGGSYTEVRSCGNCNNPTYVEVLIDGDEQKVIMDGVWDTDIQEASMTYFTNNDDMYIEEYYENHVLIGRYEWAVCVTEVTYN